VSAPANVNAEAPWLDEEAIVIEAAVEGSPKVDTLRQSVKKTLAQAYL